MRGYLTARGSQGRVTAYPRPMTIHSEHPFLPGPEEREPARRFRGRLPAPVTIVTSGDRQTSTGLTVSSLFLIEGEPPALQFVVGPNSDLWDVVAETRRFVVHICRGEHSGRADVFAGMRPSPGGVFSGIATKQSEWGPVIEDMPDRAYCSVTEIDEVGYSGVVTASVDAIEVTEMRDPLVYFRGRYRRIA